MNRPHAFLLTGVTGFLGKVVLEELVRRRDELGIARIYVPIRPRAKLTALERFERDVAASVCFQHLPAGWTDMVHVVEADLEQPNLGLPPGGGFADVTHVIHGAASVSFDLPVWEAARSNIDTALHVLEFAKTLPKLQQFVAVSTAYVTPAREAITTSQEDLIPLPQSAAQLWATIRATRSRRVERRILKMTGHPNTYTLTKCLAEHLLLERRGPVPISIVRPSIISASLQYPHPGWIDSKAGFAGFVVLLGAGHLRAVVGHGDTKLDLVPVDVVCSRILEASFPRGDEPTIRFATAGLANSPTVQQCWAGIQSFYELNRVHRPPDLRYLGPRDVKFRLADALLHGLPAALASLPGSKIRRKSKSLRTRLKHANRVFPYFTSNTFDFRASTPLPPAFDPSSYVQVICRGVHRHVLRADQAQWRLAGSKAMGHGGDFLWSMRQPEGNAWIRAASWVVTKVLRRTFDEVTVDMESFERARANRPQDMGIVIVATHRSYLDFVLVSYLAFARPDVGLPIPHIAATMEFGKLPVLGRILKSLHAFYLRRGTGKEDPDLSRRVNELINSDKALEFFIEGTRSRNREFLAPKRGLLRAIQATGKPVMLLPIALSYDRVPEERAFLQELSGAGKPKMRLGALFGWTFKAMRRKVRLGRAHIACGTPLHLTADSDVQALSLQIMDELRKATVASTFHVDAVVQQNPFLTADGLRRAIESGGGKVLASSLPADDLDPALVATLRNQFAHFLDEASGLSLGDAGSKSALEKPVEA